MATKTTLEKFLRDNPPAKKFVPYCYLDTASDSLTVYFEGDADHSKRLTDHITIFLSLETNEMVGCRIKGVKGILEDLPNFIKVNHNDVELSVIFLAFRGGVAEDVREKINDLARVANERRLVLQGTA